MKRPTGRTRHASTLVVVVATAGLLAACGSGSAGPGTPPSTAAATARAAGTATARLGDLRLSGGYIPQPASPDVAAAYVTITNSGARADVLDRVTTDVTRSVTAMGERDSGGTGSMTDLPRVRIPARGTFRFTPGHAHLMLLRPRRALRRGDRVRMTMTFRRAGTVTLRLPVLGLTGPSSGSPMPSMAGMSTTGGS